jgi:hypothetical protein
MDSSGLTETDVVDDTVVSVRWVSLGDDSLLGRERLVLGTFNVGMIGAGTCGTVVRGDIDLCGPRFGAVVY